MDFKELGLNIVEYIVANIPQILLVISTIITSFKTLNNKVTNFMEITKDGGEKLKKETLDAIKTVEAKLTKGIEDTVEKTEQTLGKMEAIIESQAVRISSLTNNVSRLEEKVSLTLDLLNVALSQDPKKISEGVARKFNERIKENKDEKTPL